MGDIEVHIQDIYGIEISDITISRISDKILPLAKKWQQRPLEAVHSAVFLGTPSTTTSEVKARS